MRADLFTQVLRCATYHLACEKADVGAGVAAAEGGQRMLNPDCSNFRWR
jgi:hypothetical protein